MDRRTFIKNCAAGFLLNSYMPVKLPASEKKRKPNIILIFADDLGWSDVGCYGSKYYETPEIDKLAKQGMRFTDAYVAAPNCAPARASLIFGQYPPRTGCYTVGSKTAGWGEGNDKYRKVIPPSSNKLIPLGKISIAQALKQGGYTSAILGKWHLGDWGDYHPLERGFDDGFIIVKPHLQTPFGPFDTRPPTNAEKNIYQTDFLTDEGIKFIEKNKDNPFFLYLSYYSSIHATLSGTIIPPAGYGLTDKYRKKKPDGKDCIPEYGAKIGRLDYNVGKIVNKIDEMNLSSDTIIIFYSDNGGVGGYCELGDCKTRSFTSNLPLKGGKSQLHEGGIRVPLIIRWPGKIKENSTCTEPVTSVDFYPTFLELASVKQPKEYSLDGVSLMPLLGCQKETLDRSIFWHFPIYYGNKAGHGEWVNTPCSAIRSGDYKLIEYFDDEHLELYDLKKDIGETNNLAKVHPDKTKLLYRKLKEWQRSINAPIPAKILTNKDKHKISNDTPQ